MNLSGKIIGACVLALALLATLDECLAEEYAYVEFSQGATLRNMPWGNTNWKGDYPTSMTLGHHWDSKGNWYVRTEVQHISNILDGPPFNHNDETWLDWVNVTAGFKF